MDLRKLRRGWDPTPLSAGEHSRSDSLSVDFLCFPVKLLSCLHRLLNGSSSAITLLPATVHYLRHVGHVSGLAIVFAQRGTFR
jgi:hypothetical protein